MPYELVREGETLRMIQIKSMSVRLACSVGIETSLKEKWDQLREQVSQLEKLKGLLLILIQLTRKAYTVFSFRVVGTSDYPIRQTVGVKLEASSDVAASHGNQSVIGDASHDDRVVSVCTCTCNFSEKSVTNC